MFIDRFTNDELAIIKRELKLTQGADKGEVGQMIRERLGETFDFKSYSDIGLFPYRKVGDAIVAIVNYTLDNFVYMNNGRTKGHRLGWYVSSVIPKEKEENYINLANDIIEIIKKYRSETKCPFEKKGR